MIKKSFSRSFFWLKLPIVKKYTLHALNPLIPSGNIRSHILKTTLVPFDAGLFKYV